MGPGLASVSLTKYLFTIAANDFGTVYFTAPLYRKNLRYSVVPKSANAKTAIKVMADYITTNHL
jgi:ATP-dependent DNA helicase Q1